MSIGRFGPRRRRKMQRFGFTVAAGIFAALLAGQAYAAAPVCTGTTLNLGTGVGLSGTVAELTGGNCLDVGDKTFGSLTITGVAGTGSVTFTAPTLQGDVTVEFTGTVAGAVGTSGTIGYSVAVNPALAGNFL